MKKARLVYLLERLKKAVEKEKELKHTLYKFKIDLANFDNPFEDISTEMLAFVIGCAKDDIDWWLYEKTAKIIWINRGCENERTLLLENAEDFINYYLETKNEISK